MSENSTPKLVGVDWGTTSLRAYLLGENAQIIASQTTEQGILGLEPNEFEPVLDQTLRALGATTADLPIVASGMVGSRQGWKECPYAPCPVDLSSLSEALTVIELASGGSVHLVPGVSTVDADGIPDVMRGEETQILGALPAGEGLAVLPGTHSKWVRCVDGRIDAFATFMTGELFAALSQHTILGRLMESSAQFTDAFERGVRYASLNSNGRGGLIRKLFSTRTLCLFDELSVHETSAYLSGLLVGSEISEALAGFAEGETPTQITVAGNDALGERYLSALALYGLRAQAAQPDAAAAGHWRIAQAARLV